MAAISVSSDIIIWIVTNIDVGMDVYTKDSILAGMFWVVLFISACVVCSQLPNARWYKTILGPFYLMSLLPPSVLMTLIFFLLSFILYAVSLAFLDQRQIFRYTLAFSKISMICGFNSFLLHIKYNELRVHRINTFLGHMTIFMRGFVDKVLKARIYLNSMSKKISKSSKLNHLK